MDFQTCVEGRQGVTQQQKSLDDCVQYHKDQGYVVWGSR